MVTRIDLKKEADALASGLSQSCHLRVDCLPCITAEIPMASADAQSHLTAAVIEATDLFPGIERFAFVDGKWESADSRFSVIKREKYGLPAGASVSADGDGHSTSRPTLSFLLHFSRPEQARAAKALLEKSTPHTSSQHEESKGGGKDGRGRQVSPRFWFSCAWVPFEIADSIFDEAERSHGVKRFGPAADAEATHRGEEGRGAGDPVAKAMRGDGGDEGELRFLLLEVQQLAAPARPIVEAEPEQQQWIKTFHDAVVAEFSNVIGATAPFRVDGKIQIDTWSSKLRILVELRSEREAEELQQHAQRVCAANNDIARKIFANGIEACYDASVAQDVLPRLQGAKLLVNRINARQIAAIERSGRRAGALGFR